MASIKTVTKNTQESKRKPKVKLERDVKLQLTN